MHPKTKNEFQFEKWLFEQYGMTSKEKTENTLMGNLNVLLEVSDVIDIAALPVGAIAVGAKLVGKKVIKEVGEKAVKEVAKEAVEKTVKREVTEEAVEKTVKREVTEEIAESTAKKEMTDTTEDLSQKIDNKNNIIEDSRIGKEERGTDINDKSVSVLKETDNFIDYVNQAGETIRINKQRSKTILDSISRNLNSSNVGTKTEATVADFINKNTNARITDFGNKIKNASGNTIGDIDCATVNELIEVKKSISSVKVDQLDKYVNVKNANYFNVDNKTVILYIDEAIDFSNVNNINKLNKIKDKGITVVNGLEELKGVIQ